MGVGLGRPAGGCCGSRTRAGWLLGRRSLGLPPSLGPHPPRARLPSPHPPSSRSLSPPLRQPSANQNTVTQYGGATAGKHREICGRGRGGGCDEASPGRAAAAAVARGCSASASPPPPARSLARRLPARARSWREGADRRGPARERGRGAEARERLGACFCLPRAAGARRGRGRRRGAGCPRRGADRGVARGEEAAGAPVARPVRKRAAGPRGGGLVLGRGADSTPRGCGRLRAGPRGEGSRWARGGGECRAAAGRGHTPLEAGGAAAASPGGTVEEPRVAPGVCGRRPGSLAARSSQTGEKRRALSFSGALGKKDLNAARVLLFRFYFNCTFLEVFEAEPKTL